MDDSLDRFLAPQGRDYPAALREIAAGRKQTHWIWWVFPQLRGLGRSERARHYGLKDAGEAAAYLAHPVLGARLTEITGALLAHAGTPSEAILGPVDAQKVQSCATLFAGLPGAPELFDRVLETFYGGARCPLTLERLA